MDSDHHLHPKSDDDRLSSAIPISQLSPTAEHLADHSIHAVVSLVWPYSSSTKSLSLLLSEPDFRLRLANGQVKATFHGPVAEEIAQTQIGIGDKVVLRLDGLRLVDNNQVVSQTPGRRVAWDIHFDSHVFLEILRSDKVFATVKIDRSVPAVQNEEGHERCPPATPGPVAERALGGDLDTTLDSWESPAFFRSSRTWLGDLANSAFDPFAEEDGYVPGKGRKRPRFSMQNSEWRVVDEPESPCDREPSRDWAETLDEDGDNEVEIGEREYSRDETDISDRPTVPEFQTTLPDNKDVSTVSEVAVEGAPRNQSLSETGMTGSNQRRPSEGPPLPETQRPTDGTKISASDKQRMFKHALNLPTETPQLHPVPSPGLPVPSPLITTSNNRSGYFAPVTTTTEPFRTSQTVSTADSADPTNLSRGFVPEPQLDPQMKTDENYLKSVASVKDVAIPQSSSSTHIFKTVGSDLAANTLIERQAEPMTTEQGNLQASPTHGPTAEVGGSILCDEFPIERLAMKGEQPDLEQRYSEDRYEDSEDEEDEQLEESDKPQESQEEYELEDGPGQNQMEQKDDEQVVERKNQLGEFEEREETEERQGDQGRPFFHHQSALSFQSRCDDMPDVGTDEVGENAEDIRVDDDIKIEEATERLVPDRPVTGFAPEEHYTHAEVEEYRENRPEQTIEQPESETEDSFESTDSQSPGHLGWERRYGGDMEEDEGEELYDEEVEDEYDSEHIYDDEDESDVVSEAAPGDNDRQYGNQQPRAQQPEVIVLDSDSDEDAPVPARHPVQHEQERIGSHEPESPKGTDEEQLISDEELLGCEVEEDFSSVDEEQPSEVEEENLGEKTMEEDYVDSEEFDEAEKEQVDQVDDEQSRDLENQERIEGRDVEGHTATRHGVTELAGEPEEDVGTQVLGRARSEHTETDLVSNQQSNAQSESDLEIVESAIDPDLRTHAVPEEKHIKQAETQPTQPSDRPNPAREVDYGLFLDGASCPRVTQESDGIVARNGQFLLSDEPLSSHETTVHDQLVSSHTVDEMLLTPQNPQNYSTHLTEQSRTDILPQRQSVTGPYAIATEVITSTSSDVSGPSSISMARQELEIKEEPSPYTSVQERANTLEEGFFHGDISSAAKTRESSVDQSEGPHREARGFRSKFSYFAPLATLVDHFGATIDTISIVHEAFPAIRAASGNGEYFVTIQVTDPSMAGTVISVQIFRRYKEALPSLVEGDAILLRNFRVRSFNHSMMLVSMDTSAWAALNGSDDDNKLQMTGPPVEYGAEELCYASKVREWYQEYGAAMVADRKLQLSIQRASTEVSPPSSAQPSEMGSDYYDSPSHAVSRGSVSSSSGGPRGSRKSTSTSTPRRITVHELRDGRRYTETMSPSEKDRVHQLRDGTLYANL